MEMRPKLLYPLLVVAAISVTVFSLLGIAAMTGGMPLAHSESGLQRLSRSDTGPDSGPFPLTDDGAVSPSDSFKLSSGRFASPGRLQASHCSNCGMVESINRVETKGKGSGLGAVAGGVAGALLGNTLGQGHGRTAMTVLGGAGGAYAGNEIERNTHKSSIYRIRVRLENGTIQTINQRQQPAAASGDHVKIVNGVVVPRATNS